MPPAQTGVIRNGIVIPARSVDHTKLRVVPNCHADFEWTESWFRSQRLAGRFGSQRASCSLKPPCVRCWLPPAAPPCRDLLQIENTSHAISLAGRCRDIHRAVDKSPRRDSGRTDDESTNAGRIRTDTGRDDSVVFRQGRHRAASQSIGVLRLPVREPTGCHGADAAG